MPGPALQNPSRPSVRTAAERSRRRRTLGVVAGAFSLAPVIDGNTAGVKR